MSQEKNEIIMAQAEQLFIEHGFHGTSMQMIAKAAGIAAGTVYLHFPSKEVLIRTIYRRAASAMLDCLLAGHDATRAPFEQYRHFWLNAYHGLRDKQNMVHFKELYERSPFFNDDDRLWADQLWQPVDAFYQQGIASGLFRNMPICMLGYLSIGSLLSIAQAQRVNPFEMTPELEDQLLQAGWHAILAQ
ncbi:TetR/AcrR family transcriptional regulator [Tolumonas lignilytica]|uniref:TetR/AcrR family transcriptional regulator n=1 Tax=Tolumonas lignilytica TaxID=1283284 RepID=UPI00046672A3|nr:TetR/AcrR family transcriptional regulator [Tolumonas lignilytica]